MVCKSSFADRIKQGFDEMLRKLAETAVNRGSVITEPRTVGVQGSMSTSQLPSSGSSAMTALFSAHGSTVILREIKSVRFNPAFLRRLLVLCFLVRQELQQHLAPLFVRRFGKQPPIELDVLSMDESFHLRLVAKH
jgi:hypothetical protein